jgi:predicted RNA binding protein YcfA (HicA-like mRNA interferase family)
MLTTSRDIIRRLEREGWTLVRVTGSHHVFKSATSAETVVVPHPRRTWEKAWFVPFIRAQDGSLIEVCRGTLHRHH